MVLRLDQAPNRHDGAKCPGGAKTAKERRYRQRLAIEIATDDRIGPRSRRRQIDVNERRKVASGSVKIGRREHGIRPEVALEHQITFTDGWTAHVRIEHGEVWRHLRTRRPRERTRENGRHGGARRRIELKRT